MPKAKKTEKVEKVAKEPKVKKVAKAAKVLDATTVIKETAEELLGKLQIESQVEVTEDAEATFKVTVQTEESGLLIGFHGETLSSFQLILGLMVYKKLGAWTRVVVEVGDYRARREEQLRAMAESYANQVIATGQPIYLPFLPPIERRIIHMALQDNPQVMTESEGEGNQRRIVIKPR